MSFDFDKAAWLQYSEKKMDYINVLSLDGQDAHVKGRFSLASSFTDEEQTAALASAVANDTDDDDDFGLEGAFGPDESERVGFKRCLRDF